MKTYEIKKMTAYDWSDKPIIDIDTPYLDTLETVKAWAQIAYDDEAILVRLWTEEYQHRATETGPVGKPYEDCCLEFFFSPMEGDLRYFNFENNAIGCYYLGIGTGLHDAVRLLPDVKEDIFNRKEIKYEKILPSSMGLKNSGELIEKYPHFFIL